MDTEKFLDNYIKEMNLIKVEDGYNLYLPFTFFNNETMGIVLHIKESENGGWYEIDDRGETAKYLDWQDTKFEDYEWKVELICRYFSLTIENNVVKGVIGFNQGLELLYDTLSKEISSPFANDPSVKIDVGISRGTDLTYMQLHNFLQGISHLSMLKLLE